MAADRVPAMAGATEARIDTRGSGQIAFATAALGAILELEGRSRPEGTDILDKTNLELPLNEPNDEWY
jgi:hypothetical protein